MSTPVSPKVTNGATWATIATLAVSFVNAATPDTLAGLGKYEPVVSGLLAIIAYAAGAYLKEDPLRTAGAAATPVPNLPSADVQAILDALGSRLEQPAPAPEPKTVPVTVTPQPGA